MDLPTRFIELSAAFGSERARWPETDRALFDLWSRTEAGAQILAEQQQLDQLLDQWQTIDRCDAVGERVMRAIAPVSTLMLPNWFTRGLAAAVICGVIAGASVLPAATVPDELDSLDSLALGDYLYEENSNL